MRQLCCISPPTEESTELQQTAAVRIASQQEVPATASNPPQNLAVDLPASENIRAFQQKKEIYLPGHFIFVIPGMEILKFFA
ncbi:hypothetical protein [Kosakonia radicincitans]|uniref:hypothetical protein n=1 Tax=Kosakonia radicincitans TaxID=283686 RepID=UPI001269FB92|nr:hypothetical protein [Kosakonia radicincitans]